MQRILAARSWVERHAVGLLFVTALALVGAIFARGIQLRMHEVIHARLRVYAIPSALSTKYFGEAPYGILAEIVEQRLPAHGGVFNNEFLRQVVAQPAV